jgi:hypothetical protein
MVRAQHVMLLPATVSRERAAALSIDPFSFVLVPKQTSDRPNTCRPLEARCLSRIESWLLPCRVPYSYLKGLC